MKNREKKLEFSVEDESSEEGKLKWQIKIQADIGFEKQIWDAACVLR